MVHNQYEKPACISFYLSDQINMEEYVYTLVSRIINLYTILTNPI